MSTSAEDATAERIRSAVAARYSTLGQEPQREDGIPRGWAWAEQLGYPPALLADLPLVAVDAFTGIGTPIFAASLQPGERVLDLGCGAGMDTLLAARRVGASGQVCAVDLAAGMITAAQQAVTIAHAENARVTQAPAEALPFADDSFDVAIVNGLFNLVPDKESVAREVMRVLRPGGRMVGAEIALGDDRPPATPDLEDWFR